MINKTVLQGRFTKKPEVEIKGGFPYCGFTIAWSEKIKDVEKKCFAFCKTWRSTAEFVEKYFDKGQECVIEGQLLTEEWEKDGQRQSRNVINVEKIHFAGSKGSTNTETTQTTETYDFMKIPEGVDEELPFN